MRYSFFLLVLLSCAHLPERGIRRLHRSVVTIQIENSEGVATAFAVSRRHMITAEHVCALGTPYYIRDGKKIILSVIAYDWYDDTCLLEGPHGLIPLSVRRSALSFGERVYVYGSPLGLQDHLTEGFAGRRELLPMGWRRRLSISSAPGNSGGPVLDARGRVVGILVMGIKGYNHISWSTTHRALRKIVALSR